MGFAYVYISKLHLTIIGCCGVLTLVSHFFVTNAYNGNSIEIHPWK